MPQQIPTFGSNATGVATHGERVQRMLEAGPEFPPTSTGTAEAIGVVRSEYSQRSAQSSVPRPTRLKGKIAEVRMPELVVDKLGERLAFERTGVRLYQALVSKHQTYGGFAGGPTLDDLKQILREELAHFQMLVEVIREAGGDPTAVTPSGNQAAASARGITEVLADPRSSLVQSLEAMMIAELTDNSGWETLSGIARKTGDTAMAARFEQAQQVEEEHVRKVRRWLQAAYGMPDGGDGG